MVTDILNLSRPLISYQPPQPDASIHCFQVLLAYFSGVESGKNDCVDRMVQSHSWSGWQSPSHKGRCQPLQLYFWTILPTQSLPYSTHVQFDNFPRAAIDHCGLAKTPRQKTSLMRLTKMIIIIGWLAVTEDSSEGYSTSLTQWKWLA